MKKLKNLKARLLSLSLAFAMVLSLAMGMAPMNVHATEGEANEKVTVTINATNHSNGFVVAYVFEGDTKIDELRNGESAEVSKTNGRVTIFCSGDHGEFEAVASGASSFEYGEAEGYYCHVTGFTESTEIVINPKNITPGTRLTIDRTNYNKNEHPALGIGVYNTDGTSSYELNAANQGLTVTIPENGYVKIVDESNEFKVTVTGATAEISDIYTDNDCGGLYCYKITNIQGNGIIVVSPSNGGENPPTSEEDIFINSLNVQIDWNKLPSLTNGSRELPTFREVPATIVGDNAIYYGGAWGIKAEDSLKITEEDSYYNDAVESIGLNDIEEYNDMVEEYKTVYGWAPLARILENPYYTINGNDTYSMYVGVEAIEGYTFGGSRGSDYEGEVTSNVIVGSKKINDDGSKLLIIFFKLGTLTEMETSKNEAAGTPAPAPTPGNGGNNGGSNGGSSSSSDSSSTPSTSTPSTAPITVPVSNGGNDNVLNINASVSGETAKVNELTAEEIDKVAKNETKDSIEINLSETGKTVKEAALPVSSLNEIARIMDDPNNKLDNITIKLSTATVEVSEHALKAVLSKTTGNDLRLVVDDVHKDTLNNTQKESVKNQNVHQCIDAYFISNGVRIGDFQGGTATIRLPFNVPAGHNRNGFSVWYVGDDGTIEKHDTRYVNGELVFTVSHFSDYVVVYDGAVKDNVPKTGEAADYTTLVWTSILAIGVLGLVLNRQKRRQ